MNRMVASRLFLDGTHHEAVGAVVDAQRVDVRRAEAQATAVARRVRHGRPEVAEAADVVHRARRVAAIARSRKEDRTARSWKIQCKLPPKTKRFCPLKTFNNAPLKSLDRWGYYYFRFFSV